MTQTLAQQKLLDSVQAAMLSSRLHPSRDAYLAQSVEQLVEPLRHFVLPQLPARALLALAQANKFLHNLVEDMAFIDQRAAYEILLPLACMGWPRTASTCRPCCSHVHMLLATVVGIAEAVFSIFAWPQISGPWTSCGPLSGQAA